MVHSIKNLLFSFLLVLLVSSCTPTVLYEAKAEPSIDQEITQKLFLQQENNREELDIAQHELLVFAPATFLFQSPEFTPSAGVPVAHARILKVFREEKDYQSQFKAVRFAADLQDTTAEFQQQKTQFLRLHHDLLIAERNLSRTLFEASGARLFFLVQYSMITRDNGVDRDMFMMGHVIDSTTGDQVWSAVASEKTVSVAEEGDTALKLTRALLQSLYNRYRNKRHLVVFDNLGRL